MTGSLPVGIIIIGVLVILFVFGWTVSFWASRYRKVGPNQVLVIYGRKSRHPITGQEIGYRLLKGGGTFVWPVVENYKVFSMELMSIDIQTPEVYTKQAIPILVDAVAQIKVENTDVAIGTAVEQFLDKSPSQMIDIAKQTLEGHLRAIIGDLSVEEINSDRDSFANRVQEVSATDLANMGMKVVSFTIQDIRDNVGYLVNLGKPQVAKVKRDASIAEAQAQRDAQIESAQARKEGQKAHFEAETEIAQSQRDYEMKKAEYSASVNLKKAEADQSYELQKNKSLKQVKIEEVNVQIAAKDRAIELEEKEIARREKELEAGIKKPAAAKQYEIQTLATAEQFRLENTAKGQAEARKATGLAEAEVVKAQGFAQAEAEKAKGMAEAAVIEAQGKAEAEAMQAKADAWRSYTEAAIIQMFIEKMPEIATAIAQPLSKMEKIVVINQGGADGAGAHKVTQDITTIMSQVPPVLESLTGVKMSDMLEKLPGLAKTAAVPAVVKKIPPPANPPQK
ncbi:MAG: SPFH domain-containing protein [Candidatus Eremiobacterota bacterium]